MNSRVLWMRVALDQLAPFLASEEGLKGIILEAMERAEAQLGDDPFAISESREGEDRIAFFPPLVLEFFVIPDARIVSIFHARLYGPVR